MTFPHIFKDFNNLKNINNLNMFYSSRNKVFIPPNNAYNCRAIPLLPKYTNDKKHILGKKVTV